MDSPIRANRFFFFFFFKDLKKTKVERKTKKEGDRYIFLSFLPETEPKTAIPESSVSNTQKQKKKKKKPHMLLDRDNIFSISKLENHLQKKRKNTKLL